MIRQGRLAALLALVLAACASPAAKVEAQPAPAPVAAVQASAAPAAQLFEVSLGAGMPATSGRLIIFARSWAADRAAPVSVRGSDNDPVAAVELAHIAPGETLVVNADELAFPAPFSKAPPGDYVVQAVLDADHTMAYSGSLTPGDMQSPVYRLRIPGGVTKVELTQLVPVQPVVRTPVGETDAQAAARTAFEAHLSNIDFESPALTKFWGRPVHIKGYVLTPPGYERGGERYPTVYRAEGFGANLTTIKGAARRQWDMEAGGDTPPMIRVFLDHSSPWGTHEFADSVNNGPWGKALTEELIPYLEKQYRMDGQPSGRFTTGHSSGGWFAIWQQVRYPNVYGGTWARAPDPVDFRSFTGIDIYRPGANAFVRPDGSAQYLVRDATGKETENLRTYALRENVLGDYGGQFDSFDWVFGPRGIDGRAQPLFDRATGEIDPKVAAYWKANYDISAIVKRDWATLKPNLDGKIHLIIGTNDTFHLNEAAALLEDTLKSVGARYDFMYMEGRNHGTLDRIGDDPNGLEKKIAWEMYAVARPKSTLKPKPYVAPGNPAQ